VIWHIRDSRNHTGDVPIRPSLQC